MNELQYHIENIQRSFNALISIIEAQSNFIKKQDEELKQLKEDGKVAKSHNAV